MSLKLTKLQELQQELLAYGEECRRLRTIAGRAVQRSGQIDVERIRRQALEDRERLEARINDLEREIGGQVIGQRDRDNRLTEV
jgi:hypothetical protein